MRTDLDRMTPRALIVGLDAERLSLAAALERDGFAVSIVSTGEDAVAAIERRRQGTGAATSSLRERGPASRAS